MRAPVLLLTVLLAAACSGSPATVTPAPSSSAGPSVLPAGRTALAVSGRVLSPDGFVPPLVLQVPAGWSSSRRGDDGFDLTRPGVTVSLVTPPDDVVATTLSRVRRAAGGTVTPVRGVLDGLPATGFDVVGGAGPLLSSPSGTLTVGAGGHLRVLGTDVEGVPLVAVVSVPQASAWPALLPEAQQLLTGITPG
ncbi:MAG: hypothetical protein ACXVFU_17955 [Nocardioidaceae bacterium]